MLHWQRHWRPHVNRQMYDITVMLRLMDLFDPPFTTFSTVNDIFFSSLFPPSLFVEILNSCMDCDEIQFKEDGNWAPMRSKKEVQEVSSASYNNGLDGESRLKEINEDRVGL